MVRDCFFYYMCVGSSGFQQALSLFSYSFITVLITRKMTSLEEDVGITEWAAPVAVDRVGLNGILKHRQGRDNSPCNEATLL